MLQPEANASRAGAGAPQPAAPTSGGVFAARLRHVEDRERVEHDNARSRRLIADLHAGLGLDQFRVVYQPIVSLPGNEIVAVEALVRWDHPELGLVPPIDFISLAEQTGFIHELGAFVLRTACAQGRAWQLAVPELRFLRVAVNLSAHQLTADAVKIVRSALDETGLAGESLELEITESVMMADLDGALQVFDALGSMGVSLSIDDFGTGMSSLAYLKRLPVGGLKIDKSFIDDLTEDARDVSIVGAVIALAAALGLTHIAEGVETDEQRRQLAALGCAMAQGYLFSRPLAADVFLDQIGHLLPSGRSHQTSVHIDGPVRVLICDDEESIRRLYRGALRSHDTTVEEVVDADACLAALDRETPDLVILDLNLPGRSGLEILQEMRDRLPQACIAVVSGVISADTTARAMASGATLCVPKIQFLPLLSQLVDECRSPATATLLGGSP